MAHDYLLFWATASAASPVVFGGNVIGGDHATAWLRRDHSGVTGRERSLGVGLPWSEAEHAGPLKPHGNAE
jgi:hypothetical protein